MQRPSAVTAVLVRQLVQSMMRNPQGTDKGCVDLASLPRARGRRNLSPVLRAVHGVPVGTAARNPQPGASISSASFWNCSQLSAGFRGSQSFWDVARSGIRMPWATCCAVCARGRSPQTANLPPRICFE